jgi:hypothetical protein
MKALTTQSTPVAGQSFSNPPEHDSFRKHPFEDQADALVDNQEKAGRVIHKALHACPSLGEESPARDVLWMTVQEEICTTTPRMIQPFGSKRPFLVTQEHATEELITAMTWLTAHEADARSYSPLHLFVMLRGVATRSSGGSARAAQADSLCGITDVPQGCLLKRGSADEVDAA